MNKLTLLLAFSVAAAASGATEAPQGSFLIRYKTSTDQVSYKVRTIDRISDQPEGGETDWTITQLDQVLTQEILKGAEPGWLRVEGAVVAEQTYAPRHEKDAPPKLTEPRPYKYAMNERGGYRDLPDISDATIVMRPKLPETAVAPGFKWTTERPVAPGLGYSVTVNHEFLEVKIEQGMPCAVIVSTAETKQGLPAGDQVAFKGNARTEVSLTDGQLVHFDGFTSLALKSTPAGETAPKVLRRETVYTALREAPGTAPEGR